MLFAGLLAWQVPTKRGVSVAVTLLAVTVIVMGAPFWGNDFGGAVAAAPGFALLGWLLLGHELRWRTVWVLVGVLVAAGLVVGVLDVLRPSDQRTHVGKFFEKAATDFGGATLVLRRKEAENLSTLGHSLLLVCLIALAVLVAYLWWVRPRSLRTLFERVSTARATAFALGIVALLGFALNDSGVTIPSMMAAVAEATVVILLARMVFAESELEESRVP
jgi:glucan phosphoethanolaminetransferase (alkaline phosphatase superfamily)